jgi:penicillin amidase
MDGNVGEQSAGLVPIRNWTGLLPVPASEGKYEWSGFVPLEQLPRTLNPSEGWIATANNRTIAEDFKHKVGFQWTRYRVERIRQVLGTFVEKGQKIRLQDAEDLQNDVYSIPADQLIGMLPRRSDGPAQRLVEKLEDWDRLLRTPSDAAALYEVWESHLRVAVLEKIAGVAASDLGISLNTQQMVDGLKSMMPPDQQKLLLSTLADAGHDLEQKEGTDAALWSWGAMHTMTFRHSLDQLAGAQTLFDLGPVSRPGDANTVDATGMGSAAFAQTSGASYRQILDLSNWDNSLAINTPGQSGNPGSRHYADLLPLWEAGQYFRLIYSKDAVEENSENVLTLWPAGSNKP